MGRQLTTEKFILKSQTVHGTQYNYKNSIYTGYKKKIEIICNKHGPFWQTPNDHSHFPREFSTTFIERGSLLVAF